MWFKKKKIVKIIDSKFKLNERVCFHHNNDFRYGYIYDIKEDENHNVIYDIQIGGECPAIIKNIAENKVVKQ